MRTIDEARGALGLGTCCRRLARDLDAPARTAALAWLPLAGALVGAAAAVLAAAADRLLLPAGAVVGALALDALGGRGIGLATAVKAAALLVVPTGARWVPLVLAPVLGRWAQTVQHHGGRAPAGEAAGTVRAQFREFGWASVVALGAALALLDAVGLLAALAAALATLAMRVELHRRHGGMPAWGPGATASLVELIVVVVLAALAPLAAG